MKLLPALFVTLLSLPLVSTAAPRGQVEGLVTRIILHSEDYPTYDETKVGYLQIYMDELPTPNGPGCNNGIKRVAIRSSHPLFAAVHAAVLAAQTTGKPIKLTYLEECTLRTSSWDFALLG